MDYEKKYNEAIKRAKQHCADYVVETIFPELKESESNDERIRKNLISYINISKHPMFSERERNEMLAWLEKQSEQQDVSIQINPSEYINDMGGNGCYLKNTTQKPAELPKGEDYGIDGLYHAIRILEETIGSVDGYQSNDGILEHKCAISAVKQLAKQNNAWSKEDDEHLERILKELENQRQRPLNSPYLDKIESDYNWLKSIKDRYTWKPSERQKEALLWCVVHLGGADKQTLGELLEELNKL